MFINYLVICLPSVVAFVLGFLLLAVFLGFRIHHFDPLRKDSEIAPYLQEVGQG